jgi:hypothetical protein
VASLVLGSAAVGILLFVIMQLVLPSILANVVARLKSSNTATPTAGESASFAPERE